MKKDENLNAIIGVIGSVMSDFDGVMKKLATERKFDKLESVRGVRNQFYIKTMPAVADARYGLDSLKETLREMDFEIWQSNDREIMDIMPRAELLLSVLTESKHINHDDLASDASRHHTEGDEGGAFEKMHEAWSVFMDDSVMNVARFSKTPAELNYHMDWVEDMTVSFYRSMQDAQDAFVVDETSVDQLRDFLTRDLVEMDNLAKDMPSLLRMGHDDPIKAFQSWMPGAGSDEERSVAKWHTNMRDD